MTDQPMTWLAIVLAVVLGGGIILFVWAMGAPGRRRPDREPAGEKIPPKTAQPHNDPRQSSTPIHARHNVQRRRDGMEVEKDFLKDAKEMLDGDETPPRRAGDASGAP